MTYFCVRSDTRKIFDAVNSIPKEAYLKAYSEAYGCEIAVIEGATVATCDHQGVEYFPRNGKLRDEVLAKTQMALGRTFPWINNFFSAQCIHCGRENSYLNLKFKRHKDLHEQNCVWLIALLTTGDYEEDG